mmetsp:Transcript_74807/g.173310  ORF Transcript_74807/g.173310 Transcript_74807/m.173310 type:complete len:331 (+) Transcript_74807:82-1074(+)
MTWPHWGLGSHLGPEHLQGGPLLQLIMWRLRLPLPLNVKRRRHGTTGLASLNIWILLLLAAQVLRPSTFVPVTRQPCLHGSPCQRRAAATLTEAEEREVGNLVEDDEWLGLGMELAIVLRCSIREGAKGALRDFLGKDNYELGDVSKEADQRVKALVAEIRGKPDYEIGDLSLALDEIAKDEVCKFAGKEPGEYEFGDLSTEVDRRVKAMVVEFSGKESYEPGDLSRTVAERTATAVADFTGKEGYTFGDISREIEQRRAQWVSDFLGTQDYQFGDITKKLIADFTGKEDYQFGDVTKRAISNFTGKDEYEFGDITRTIGQALFGNKPKK